MVSKSPKGGGKTSCLEKKRQRQQKQKEEARFVGLRERWNEASWRKQIENGQLLLTDFLLPFTEKQLRFPGIQLTSSVTTSDAALYRVSQYCLYRLAAALQAFRQGALPVGDARDRTWALLHAQQMLYH